MFCPSGNFRQYCADLSKAVSTSAMQGTRVDENNWLRSWSHETYLWYDEIEDVDPACCTTPEYFNLMKTNETTSSGNPKDRFHFSQPTREYRKLSNEGVTVGYGARFRVLQSTPPRNVVVVSTEPNSPATATGVNLVRGTQILGVDGIDIVNSTDADDVKKINAALNPSDGDTHTFTVKDPGSSSVERSVTMTAGEITNHPVQNVKVITTSEGERVGYMLFNSHNDPAALPLINAGNTFLQGDGIDDLVLDLRYNRGGFLYIAQIITSIIAGSAGDGKNFATNEYNGKRNNRSRSFANAFEDESGTVHQLPDLDLPRLFVLTTFETASASELIINSLLGIDIDVIRIGSSTRGKYHGFVSTDNCGTTYSSIQFRVVNDKGVANYDDGFSPTCSVADNDYDHQLGDPEESLLKTALAYQADDACPSSSSAQVRGAETKSPQEELLSIDPVPSPYSSFPGLILNR
ncbi:MAG: peptidase [Candidatus Dadabacteria bacterium]|nr:peptidase [Candidatus Dadabacteria bacterium]MYK48673.1 peptidase [Candidatus Dadabacteria bacterium]